MKTEQATYTESKVQELIAKAIKQDREFQAQVLRALPLVATDVKQGWIENPKSLERELGHILCPTAEKEQSDSILPSPSTILRLISRGEKLTIPACTGTRTIAQAEEVFPGHLDPSFRSLDEPGRETGATDTEVYETANSATCKQMFTSLGHELGRLAFTQDQVITFIEKHRKWLRKGGYDTLFLFKKGDQFFVADVYIYPDGRLRVYPYGFEHNRVWYAAYRERVVVPSLRSSGATAGTAQLS